jgi:hypothetical protein
MVYGLVTFFFDKQTLLGTETRITKRDRLNQLLIKREFQKKSFSCFDACVLH